MNNTQGACLTQEKISEEKPVSMFNSSSGLVFWFMNDCMRTELFSSGCSCWGNFSFKLDKKKWELLQSLFELLNIRKLDCTHWISTLPPKICMPQEGIWSSQFIWFNYIKISPLEVTQKNRQLLWGQKVTQTNK